MLKILDQNNTGTYASFSSLLVAAGTILRLGGMMPLFCFSLFWYYLILTFIHYITFSVAIRRGSSSSPHRWSAQWEKSMGCRAENQTRACLTASRRTTNRAAPLEKLKQDTICDDHQSCLWFSLLMVNACLLLLHPPRIIIGRQKQKKWLKHWRPLKNIQQFFWQRVVVAAISGLSRA